jgi:hypothetical protein
MECIEISAGSLFGRLTVIEKVGVRNRHMLYRCKCDCGNEKNIRGSALVSGNTESCGCKNKDQAKSMTTARKIEGVKDDNGKITPEYHAWRAIRSRCYRKTNKKYKNYGGRGIIVCDRWLQSFTNFLNDMGLRPIHCSSIDRINVNGNYEPGNCRWANEEQQAANKTTTIRLIVNGKEIHQAGLAKSLAVCPHTISSHMRKGETGDQIVEYFKNKNQHASTV